MPTKLKICARTVCTRCSDDPKRDRWVWVEFDAEIGLNTGWWCPECTEGLRRAMEAQGVEPVIERRR
jgi:hypothetical protein